VWGSDWPHVANWGVMKGVSDLLALLADWVTDSALRNRILVDNPQRLFGFPPVT
jgi:predicted TIM-barrel fold metal-dependent hydrolase